MSYEGYTEVLCSNGHRRVFDCWDDSWMNYYPYDGTGKEACKCSCGASFVWSHEVDETNCEPEPANLEVNTEEEWIMCDMGHKHVIKEVTYKIPVKVN